MSVFTIIPANAKIRGMYGRLLDREDYETLCTRNNIGEIVAFLKACPNYSESLKGIHEINIHRASLENTLRISFMNDYLKIAHHLSGKLRKFFEVFHVKYESEFIKNALRILYSQGRDLSDKLSGVHDFFEKYTGLDADKLCSSKSIREFVENLRGTEYFTVLSSFLSEYEKLNLFDLEMALDMYFFYCIKKSIETFLSGSEREYMEKSFGRECDVMNIIWVYRCKNIFTMSNNFIMGNFIPVGTRIGREILTELCESQDDKNFVSIMQKTPYKDFFDDYNDVRWDIKYHNIISKEYKRQIHGDILSIYPIYSYLYLREMEIKNLVTIIESIRYGFSKEQISLYLMGVSL